MTHLVLLEEASTNTEVALSWNNRIQGFIFCSYLLLISTCLKSALSSSLSIWRPCQVAQPLWGISRWPSGSDVQ